MNIQCVMVGNQLQCLILSGIKRKKKIKKKEEKGASYAMS